MTFAHLLIAIGGAGIMLVLSVIAAWWGQYVVRQSGPPWIWGWAVLCAGLVVWNVGVAIPRALTESIALSLLLGVLPAWRMARVLTDNPMTPFRHLYWRVAMPLLLGWAIFVAVLMVQAPK